MSKRRPRSLNSRFHSDRRGRTGLTGGRASGRLSRFESLEDRRLLDGDPGELDLTFGDAGYAVVAADPHVIGASTAYQMLEVESQHVAGQVKVVVLAESGQGNNLSSQRLTLFRLNADGTRDATFGDSVEHQVAVGGLLPVGFNDLHVRPQLLVRGDAVFVMRSSGNQLRVAKYDLSGELDLSFGVAGVVNTGVNEAILGTQELRDAPQLLSVSDGFVVVARTINHLNGGGLPDGPLVLLKYADDGQLDPSYGVGGRVDLPAPLVFDGYETFFKLLDATVQDDQVIVYADVLDANIYYRQTTIIRINADGTLDTTLTSSPLIPQQSNTETIDGVLAIDDPNVTWGYIIPGAVAAQGNQIVTLATDNEGYQVLQRHNNDGSRDFMFGDDGNVVLPKVDPLLNQYGFERFEIDVVARADGKLLVYGFDNAVSQVFAFNDDGTPDLAFGVAGVLTPALGNIRGIGVDDDGDLLTVGFVNTAVFPGPSAIDVVVARYEGPRATTHVDAARIASELDQTVTGRTTSFTVAATDDSGAIEAAGFEYEVDWGDGSAPTIIARTPGNASGVTIAHAYDAPDNYSVTVVATNSLAESQSAATTIIASSMLFDEASGSPGQLWIGSTSGDDEIALTVNVAYEIEVVINGASVGVFNSLGPDLPGVTVFTQGGADHIGVDATLPLFVLIQGHQGADHIEIDSNTAGGVQVLGAEGDDSIHVHSSGPGGVGVDGQGGSDAYEVDFGNLGGGVSFVDRGRTGTNSLIANGTPGNDYIVKDSNEQASGFIVYGDPPQGGFEFSPTEGIDYLGIAQITINGGDGDDTMIDPGSDTMLFGGAGNDTIIIDATTGSGVAVDGGQESDIIIVVLGNLLGPVVVTDSGFSGIDALVIQGTPDADQFVVTGAQVTAAAAVVHYSTGIETLAVHGGEGNDAVEVASTGAAPLTVDGQAGVDSVTIQLGSLLASVTLYDSGVNGVGNVTILGTAGNDAIAVSASGVSSGGQSITLATPVATLTVDAGADNDTITVANMGNSASSLALVGGTGNDSFVLNNVGASVSSLLIDGGGENNQVTVTGALPADTQGQNIAPTAEVSGPEDGVRGQKRTFTLHASDLSAADQSAGFAFTINWGDGSPLQQIARTPGNGAGVSVDHVFAAVGTYQVRVTATDQAGEGSAEAITLTAVSVAALQVDPQNPNYVELVIGGSDGDDRIKIVKGPDPGEVRVRIRDEDHLRYREVFDPPISRIVVYAQGGDDEVDVGNHLAVPAWIYGGPGNDDLRGGRGDDVIFGEEGDDLLVGAGGRDLLIGGVDSDLIAGNSDDDILIAGFVDFGDPSAALAAIMAEWTSDRTYAARTANLAGTGSGTRLNGNYFLTVNGPTATVRDDNAKDTLAGDAGRDWFFANLVLDSGDDANRKDKITDLSANEFAADLDFIFAE